MRLLPLSCSLVTPVLGGSASCRQGPYGWVKGDRSELCGGALDGSGEKAARCSSGENFVRSVIFLTLRGWPPNNSAGPGGSAPKDCAARPRSGSHPHREE